MNVELDSMKNVTEQADEESEDFMVDEKNPKEKIGSKSEEKVEEELGLEGEQAEGGKESIDSPVRKDEAKASGEDKETAAMYKDNKNVVLREDLKSIFQKFGFVKVR